MSSFLSLYKDIEHKIEQTKLFIDKQRSDNQFLREQLGEEKKKNEELEEEIAILKEKNKVLTITNTVLYKEDKKETIKRINEYVREIDNCIALLNRIEWKTKR